MVVTDALSKWPEIFVTENTSAEDTVSTLRSLFARMGLPDQIVSDNGPQFTSKTRQFSFANGIKHVTGAPHHSSANTEILQFALRFFFYSRELRISKILFKVYIESES